MKSLYGNFDLMPVGSYESDVLGRNGVAEYSFGKQDNRFAPRMKYRKSF